MKRFLALLLAMSCLLGLSGCGKQNGTPSGGSSQTEQSGSASGGTEKGSAKLGLSMWVEQGSFIAAGKDGDGSGSLTFLAAAVVLSPEGKLMDCRFDEAEGAAFFNESGAITSPPQQKISTKMQKGDDYNMKESSAIGKEWYEQAEFLASYLKGKTAEELKSFALDEKGYPTDGELLAGCTIKVAGYLEGILAAMEQAEEFDGEDTDPLFLGISTKMTEASGADGDGDGRVAVSMTAAAVTQSGDGKITGCKLDCMEGHFAITGSGQPIPAEGELKSKAAQKEDYGMKKVSPIGKEWYEQAEGFAKYVLNKTGFEVGTIAVDEENRPTDADLSAACTIDIGDFLEAMEDAVGEKE